MCESFIAVLNPDTSFFLLLHLLLKPIHWPKMGSSRKKTCSSVLGKQPRDLTSRLGMEARIEEKGDLILSVYLVPTPTASVFGKPPTQIMFH